MLQTSCQTHNAISEGIEKCVFLLTIFGCVWNASARIVWVVPLGLSVSFFPLLSLSLSVWHIKSQIYKCKVHLLAPFPFGLSKFTHVAAFGFIYFMILGRRSFNLSLSSSLSLFCFLIIFLSFLFVFLIFCDSCGLFISHDSLHGLWQFFLPFCRLSCLANVRAINQGKELHLWSLIII